MLADFQGETPRFSSTAIVWNATHSLIIINGISLRQRVTPERLQSRVNAAGRMIAWGGTPFGAAVAGLLADTFDIRTALFLTSIAIFISACSEPLPVAQTFVFEDEYGESLSKVARLDTMITVVDAFNFLNDFESVEGLKERGESMGEADERTIVDLLVDQVEFADVILLNKTDLVTPEHLAKVEATIKALNRNAKLIRTSQGKVDLKEVLNTNRFDLEKASESAAWLQELNNVHTPETEEYGIKSFVFTARKPFHSERLHDMLDDEALDNVVRAKGMFWLATRPAYTGLYSKAGNSHVFEAIGTWFDTIPEEMWGIPEEDKVMIKSNWHPAWGDREQRIVFIGIDMNEATIRERLESALVSDDEAEAGLALWSTFVDPLPSWE